jgi:hypothetical protein
MLQREDTQMVLTIVDSVSNMDVESVKISIIGDRSSTLSEQKPMFQDERKVGKNWFETAIEAFDSIDGQSRGNEIESGELTVVKT